MNVSRRDFAVASALAFGASGLLFKTPADAQGSDEAAVAQSIEALRQGILQQDKAKLDQVAASQISYGHSDGRVETKEQFINGVMNRKQTQKSLAFPELKVAVVGNVAIARHIYLGESELDGKQSTTRIGALQLWQKQDAGWKLVARQGFRLPAA
ncbi:MAG TPA: nuclear transport factor 2 family protein [Burkholderiales bacterium]|nr:nuclear transport factor 2 family protein [Burkholderiales bacterium]